MRKILPILLMVGPYLLEWIVVGVSMGEQVALLLLVCYLPLCLVFFILHWINAFVAFRDENAAYELAFWNLLIKIAHIPYYMTVIHWIILFRVKIIVLILFCMYGIAALIKAYRAGKIPGWFAVVNGILHFCIWADVVSAIWLFLKIRKNKNL